ncbi:MAG TPA: hypothetical protein VGN94_14065 [Methylobacterium sp.]|nr:hypothetical protein [Methylobacterium sp.]
MPDQSEPKPDLERKSRLERLPRLEYEPYLDDEPWLDSALPVSNEATRIQLQRCVLLQDGFTAAVRLVARPSARH